MSVIDFLFYSLIKKTNKQISQNVKLFQVPSCVVSVHAISSKRFIQTIKGQACYGQVSDAV